MCVHLNIRCKFCAVVRNNRSRDAFIGKGCSSSRVKRNPEIEVSSTNKTFSLVKSSTTVRMRKRLPPVRASDTKSKLQCRFGTSGIAMGRRVPRAQFRAPLQRICNFFFCLNASQFFVVHVEDFRLHHDIDAAITKLPTLFRNTLNRFALFCVVKSFGLISNAGTIGLQYSARPTFRHAVRFTKIRRGLFLSSGVTAF